MKKQVVQSAAAVLAAAMLTACGRQGGFFHALHSGRTERGPEQHGAGGGRANQPARAADQ